MRAPSEQVSTDSEWRSGQGLWEACLLLTTVVLQDSYYLLHFNSGLRGYAWGHAVMPGGTHTYMWVRIQFNTAAHAIGCLRDWAWLVDCHLRNLCGERFDE
jgi:hypothetical protein